MNKLIAMLMALLLILSLAACASKEENAPVEEETPVVEDTPAVEEEPVVEEEPAVEEEDPTMNEPAAMPEETPEEAPEVMPEVTPEEEAPAAPATNGALYVLNAVWAAYDDSEKFSIIGGNMEAAIMDAPGVYDMAYAENMTFNLLIPAEQIANVTEVASMIHMMNANTFTCGVFRLADGVTSADFAAAMEAAVMGNMWMCGFPETLLIQEIAASEGTYVLVAFGVNDAMNPFAANLAEAWPGAVTLYNEPIV